MPTGKGKSQIRSIDFLINDFDKFNFVSRALWMRERIFVRSCALTLCKVTTSLDVSFFINPVCARAYSPKTQQKELGKKLRQFLSESCPFIQLLYDRSMRRDAEFWNNGKGRTDTQRIRSWYLHVATAATSFIKLASKSMLRVLFAAEQRWTFRSYNSVIVSFRCSKSTTWTWHENSR